MKKLILLLVTLMVLSACTESERPAAKAKHALDSAQQAADLTTKQSQNTIDQAQKALDGDTPE